MSLRGRHQYIPAQGADPEHPGSPSRWAHSVLLRGQHTLERGRLAFVLAAQLGGGDGIRFRFPPRQDFGLPASDTSRAGPVLLGPAGGLLYRLNPRLALAADLQVFVSAPHVAAIADSRLRRSDGLLASTRATQLLAACSEKAA